MILLNETDAYTAMRALLEAATDREMNGTSVIDEETAHDYGELADKIQTLIKESR